MSDLSALRARCDLDAIEDNESRNDGIRSLLTKDEALDLVAEVRRLRAFPLGSEGHRLDTMWQEMVRERDDAVRRLRAAEAAAKEWERRAEYAAEQYRRRNQEAQKMEAELSAVDATRREEG